MKIYSARQAEQVTGIKRNRFPLFRKYGLLKGVKFGDRWKYDEDELNALIKMCRGYDLSTESSIRYYAPEILKVQKK